MAESEHPRHIGIRLPRSCPGYRRLRKPPPLRDSSKTGYVLLPDGSHLLSAILQLPLSHISFSPDLHSFRSSRGSLSPARSGLRSALLTNLLQGSMCKNGGVGKQFSNTLCQTIRNVFHPVLLRKAPRPAQARRLPPRSGLTTGYFPWFPKLRLHCTLHSRIQVP